MALNKSVHPFTCTRRKHYIVLILLLFAVAHPQMAAQAKNMQHNFTSAGILSGDVLAGSAQYLPAAAGRDDKNQKGLLLAFSAGSYTNVFFSDQPISTKNDAMYQVDVSDTLAGNVLWVIGYNYWKTTIFSNELKGQKDFSSHKFSIGYNYSLFSVYQGSASFVHTIYFESNSTTEGFAGGMGAGLQFRYTLYQDKVQFIIGPALQYGLEMRMLKMSLNYSMLSYTAGIAINIF